MDPIVRRHHCPFKKRCILTTSFSKLLLGPASFCGREPTEPTYISISFAHPPHVTIPHYSSIDPPPHTHPSTGSHPPNPLIHTHTTYPTHTQLPPHPALNPLIMDVETRAVGQKCQTCHGKGEVLITCGKCKGEGNYVIEGEQHTCVACTGDGLVMGTCSECAGTGGW